MLDKMRLDEKPLEKPEIPYFEDGIEALINDLFQAYNCVGTSPLDRMNREDLTTLKGIIEMMHGFLCAICHNENKRYEHESRRKTWIERHHSIFISIRHHISDLQDDKISFDFTPIHDCLRELIKTAIAFVEGVSKARLKQDYYTRVQLYKFHRRAAALHCAIHHTYVRLEENKRSNELEGLFARIHQRIAELYDSFQDQPHHLHVESERFPHLNFTHM